MSPATQPESTLVARLIVAVVALSSLAAGSALVGSAIDSATDASIRFQTRVPLALVGEGAVEFRFG